MRQDERLLVEVHALKRMVLLKAGRTRDEQILLQANERAWVEEGDAIYLVQDHDELSCGFELRKQRLTVQQTTIPFPKRKLQSLPQSTSQKLQHLEHPGAWHPVEPDHSGLQSVSPAPYVTEQVPTSAQQFSQTHDQSRTAVMPAATDIAVNGQQLAQCRPNLEQAPDPPTLPQHSLDSQNLETDRPLRKAVTPKRSLHPQQQQQQNIFEGCHFVFWARSHLSHLIAKVKQLGGKEDSKPGKGTTHVVARFGMDADDVATKLRGCDDLEFSARTSGSDPAANALPKHIHFVTPEFLSRSIARGQRQREELFHIRLHQFQRNPTPTPLPSSQGASAEGESHRLASQPLAASQPSHDVPGVPMDAESAPQERQASPPPASPQRPATPPGLVTQLYMPLAATGAQSPPRLTATPHIPEGLASQPPGPTQLGPYQGPTQFSSWNAATQPPPSASEATQPPHMPRPTQLDPATAPASQQGRRTDPHYGEWVVAMSGARVLVPTQDQICPAGHWGDGGRWIEPWDEAAAREGLAKLLAHWTRRDRTAPFTPAASQDSGNAEQQQQQVMAPGGPGLINPNGVCSHPACSRQPVCIVDELRKVRQGYLSGRRDQFRVKAVDSAIRAVEALAAPLVHEQDVVRLHLGKKTTDKLTEILATGSYRRTALLEADERQQVLGLFQRVWGVGETTAENWFAAGCRTLEDVRRRQDLTETQRIGLKYFDDFERRIPRAEVAECEELVAQVTADILSDMTGQPAQDIRQQLHCRVVGSYLRGKADCGDIDFVVAAPPRCGEVATPVLLSSMVDRLTQRGFIARDLPISKARLLAGGEQEQERCTYMGIWRGPSSPCARRIDFKVYPWSLLALGVNYFGSSRDFCKALRYWCNTPNSDVEERARSLNPEANAFKLSDTYFGPIKRAKRRAHESEVLGPFLQYGDETSIFAAVGLPYIPPHMREV